LDCFKQVDIYLKRLTEN